MKSAKVSTSSFTANRFSNNPARGRPAWGAPWSVWKGNRFYVHHVPPALHHGLPRDRHARHGPTAAQEEAKPAPTVFSDAWMQDIRLGAHIQAGVTFNTRYPQGGINFGNLFNDQANIPTLNQAAITLARQIDPKTTGFDMGFKLQFMLGSDSRFTHYLGILNYTTTGRYQFDLVEANVTMRLPVLTAGGIDLKMGLYPTPIGFETIDPSTNPFYSHSYIFAFGLPFKHTGLYAVAHLTDWLDIHLGVDSGMNTFLGRRGDNNSSAAFIAGLGLNLFDGKLTVLALTHAGPENAGRAVGPGANSYFRFSNDILVTYKATDALTFVTELNLIRDDLARASAYGIAQYVSYALNDNWALNARGEIFRDDKGFFVAAFPTNTGPINALGGYPAPIIGTGPTTYGAITFGATWKPDVPKPLGGLMVRPEIRYDRILAGAPALSGRRGALTLAADLVINF
jgi:hypothetical protein